MNHFINIKDIPSIELRKIIKDVTLHPASLESYPSIIKVIQKKGILKKNALCKKSNY